MQKAPKRTLGLFGVTVPEATGLVIMGPAATSIWEQKKENKKGKPAEERWWWL